MFKLSIIKKLIDNEKDYFILKLIFFLNFINFSLELLSILSIPIFISLLFDQSFILDKYGSYIPEYLLKYNLIFLSSILVIILYLIKNSFYTLLIYKQTNFIRDLKIKISKKIFSQYLLGSYKNHLKKDPSQLTRDTTYSVQCYGFYLLHLINLFRETVSVLFIFLLLFLVKPTIIIISTIFLISIAFIFQKGFKEILKKKANQNQTLNQHFTKDVYNAFLSIKDIKVLNKELEILNKFNFKIEKYENNLFFFEFLERLPKAILEILSLIFLLSISLFLSQITIASGELFIILSLFLVATVRLLPSFTSINSSLNYLKIFEPSLTTLFKEKNKFTNLSKFKKDKFEEKTYSKNIKLNKKIISLKKISFYFKQNKYFLKNLNLDIFKNEMLCIIGKTGSGKSTLLNIMLGLLDPQKGEIYFNGESIKKDKSKWRESIGFVSQDPYLLDDSIINNITFNITNDRIDFKRLKKAIKYSLLEETIKKLDKGLHTKVSMQGINLSGGEKQRIALARALYKDPDIFFLDEFTNAIDELTEKKIIINLKKLKNKTFVIISHKKSTIDQCDKIWKLDKFKLNLQRVTLNKKINFQK